MDKPVHIQRSATTDCREDHATTPPESPPEIRRSISMDNEEASGIKKAVLGYSGSFKRCSIRVSKA